ncbi:MAG: MoaD/ThiS family protein [Dehalococcoidia bacterium]
MGVKVQIPLPLRGSTGGLSEVEATGSSVREVIADLETSYPGIRERLFGGDGELSRFVSIFVQGQDIRLLEGLETAVKGGDVVTILPLAAGG